MSIHTTRSFLCDYGHRGRLQFLERHVSECLVNVLRILGNKNTHKLRDLPAQARLGKGDEGEARRATTCVALRQAVAKEGGIVKDPVVLLTPYSALME